MKSRQWTISCLLSFFDALLQHKSGAAFGSHEKLIDALLVLVDSTFVDEYEADDLGVRLLEVTNCCLEQVIKVSCHAFSEQRSDFLQFEPSHLSKVAVILKDLLTLKSTEVTKALLPLYRHCIMSQTPALMNPAIEVKFIV